MPPKLTAISLEIKYKAIIDIGEKKTTPIEKSFNNKLPTRIINLQNFIKKVEK